MPSDCIGCSRLMLKEEHEVPDGFDLAKVRIADTVVQGPAGPHFDLFGEFHIQVIVVQPQVFLQPVIRADWKGGVDVLELPLQLLIHGTNDPGIHCPGVEIPGELANRLTFTQ